MNDLLFFLTHANWHRVRMWRGVNEKYDHNTTFKK